MVKQMSDNEIYLLVKYIKSSLWRVAKRLSYTEDARCLLYTSNTKLHTMAIKVLEDLELPDPKNEDTTIIRNIGIYRPNESAHSPKMLGEPQIRRWRDGFRTFTCMNMGKEATPNRQKNICTQLLRCASYFGCSRNDQTSVIFRESPVRCQRLP